DAHCISLQTTRDQSTLRVARRRPAGDVYAHRRGPPTTTRTADCRLWRQRRPGQMGPRPGRGRAGGAVPRSRFRRNPKGAWVLLGSAIVRLAKIARPRMRAIAALLLLDDPHRDRLRRAGRSSGLSLPVARPRIRALRTTECQNNHSVTGTLCVLASLPQPDLKVRSLRNAARQYPCARPLILSPRAASFSLSIFGSLLIRRGPRHLPIRPRRRA